MPCARGAIVSRPEVKSKCRREKGEQADEDAASDHHQANDDAFCQLRYLVLVLGSSDTPLPDPADEVFSPAVGHFLRHSVSLYYLTSLSRWPAFSPPLLRVDA